VISLIMDGTLSRSLSVKRQLKYQMML